MSGTVQRADLGNTKSTNPSVFL